MSTTQKREWYIKKHYNSSKFGGVKFDETVSSDSMKGPLVNWSAMKCPLTWWNGVWCVRWNGVRWNVRFPKFTLLFRLLQVFKTIHFFLPVWKRVFLSVIELESPNYTTYLLLSLPISGRPSETPFEDSVVGNVYERKMPLGSGGNIVTVRSKFNTSKSGRITLAFTS